MVISLLAGVFGAKSRADKFFPFILPLNVYQCYSSNLILWTVISILSLIPRLIWEYFMTLLILHKDTIHFFLWSLSDRRHSAHCPSHKVPQWGCWNDMSVGLSSQITIQYVGITPTYVLEIWINSSIRWKISRSGCWNQTYVDALLVRWSTKNKKPLEKPYIAAGCWWHERSPYLVRFTS